MGRNNQQRRAAKKRKKQEHNSSRGQRPQGRPAPAHREPNQDPYANSAYDHGPYTHDSYANGPYDRDPYDRTQWTHKIQQLIDRGARLTEVRGRAAADEIIEDLLLAEQQAPAPEARPSRMLTERVLHLISHSWERGWQPRDLVHAMGRVVRPLGELAATAVAEQARRTGAAGLAPPDWLAQLEDIGGTAEAIPPWRVIRPTDPIASWRLALRLHYRIGQLHPLPRLGPPPSQWREDRDHSARGRSYTPPRSTARHDPGDKILKRIRALLSKAEATDYAEEAEAFTAKAQDLMTRHAIDEALLHADDGKGINTAARRIHLDDPYALMKAGLLGAVGHANRAQSIWDGTGGFATIVGLPVDLEQVEMLFVSLLIQATRAMTAAGDGQRSHSVDRSRSFRKSFLMAYASRIGQRLESAAESATASYGTDLVPIFARQEEAVSEAFEELFPNVRRGGTTRVNLRGWQAGSTAADEAVLPAGRIEGAN